MPKTKEDLVKELVFEKELVSVFRSNLRRMLADHGIESSPEVSSEWILENVWMLFDGLKIRERLNKITHVVEHMPNCPSPFLVRLVGPGASVVDKQPYEVTKDILGFGQTLQEAAEDAFVKADKATG